MTFTAGSVIRLALLAAATAIVQTAAVAQVSIFGVSPDLTPLVVASVGLLGGSLAGAGFGFAAGLLVDTLLLQTLGVSSLVFTAVGYGAGRVLELRDPANGLAPVAVGAAATAAAMLGFALVSFLLGIDAPVSLLLVRDLVVTIAVNALLALPVYAVVRRVVLRYLPADPRRRRRRAYTTGGLSPLNRA